MFIGKDGCRNGLTAHMPSPETVAIACGRLSARLRPAWGGRMTHLRHFDYGDILVPTMEQEFEPFNWPRAGAYPLFPYHNRLYGGRLRLTPCMARLTAGRGRFQICLRIGFH